MTLVALCFLETRYTSHCTLFKRLHQLIDTVTTIFTDCRSVGSWTELDLNYFIGGSAVHFILAAARSTIDARFVAQMKLTDS